MINQLLQLNVPLPERSGRFRLSIFVFFAKLQQKKQSLSINQEIIRKDIKKNQTSELLFGVCVHTQATYNTVR